MDNYDYYEEHALTEKLSKSEPFCQACNCGIYGFLPSFTCSVFCSEEYFDKISSSSLAPCTPTHTYHYSSLDSKVSSVFFLVTIRIPFFSLSSERKNMDIHNTERNDKEELNCIL
ncbi:hypothetical protein llap_10004 [Limosa lapponica baueri]|uniref:Uncharacterized protein n=1 Tax=Limosa lapponica baueri TaxID=1758121 RepID=A0A2I0U0Y9_LIMLA|nr:hypothetical protein llap_10004 [Limosa lapponica baueri]